MKLSQLRSLIKQEVRRTMNESRKVLPQDIQDEIDKVKDHPEWERALSVWVRRDPKNRQDVATALNMCNLWIEDGVICIQDEWGVTHKWTKWEKSFGGHDFATWHMT